MNVYVQRTNMGLPSEIVIRIFLIPLVAVRGEGALFCWLFARFLS